MMPKSRQHQSGYLMLLVIIMGAVFLMMITAVASLSTANLKSSRTSLAGLSALSVAEAGADNAIFNINKNNAYTGTNTSCPISGTGSNPVTFFNDSVRGKGTFETCIAAGTIANERILYATGKLYQPANSTKPTIRKLKLVLIGTYTGTYGVQTGPGGLILSNSATVVNGDVYVGGTITMSNSAAIGSAANPLNVWAADYVCPKSGNQNPYPMLCGVGTGDPITINGPQAHIYGTVNANNQTTTTGMTNPGLVATSGIANSTLPDYDRTSQKAAVASTITAASASCGNNETRSWPANVHITGGDVTVSHNCVVTLNGNVWIDGGLSLTQKGIIKPANSVASMPTVMVDGSDGIVFGNQTSVSSNSAQIGIQFITFWANSGCSPDCSNLTGSGLANSQGVVTINISNQGLSSGSVLYARWSKVLVGNSGGIGQIMGQTIEFNNTGNITFGTASSNGQPYTYAMRYYEQL